jgi:transcription elongation factor Elf1
MSNKKQKEEGINITVSLYQTPTYQLSFLWTCPVCNYKIYDEYDYEDNKPNEQLIQDTLECLAAICTNCQTEYTLEIKEDKDKNIYKLFYDN